MSTITESFRSNSRENNVTLTDHGSCYLRVEIDGQTLQFELPGDHPFRAVGSHSVGGLTLEVEFEEEGFEVHSVSARFRSSGGWQHYSFADSEIENNSNGLTD